MSIAGSPNSKKPYNEWSVHGSRARGFLMTIYGFLGSRRQNQVLTALTAYPRGARATKEC